MTTRRPLTFPLHLKQRDPHRVRSVQRGQRLALGSPWFKGYRVQRKIGEGRMASVYLAHDMERGGLVAIKVLRASPAADAERASAFLREFSVPAALQSRHVIRVVEQFSGDGRAAVAMEYLPGGDLSRCIRAGIDAAGALSLLRQAAQALDAVHRRGFVHGDVKPANLLLRARGELVLADFGLARRLDAPLPISPPGRIVGTPLYAAPEQSRDGGGGTAADVYSLGVVFYEMLCGKPPFPGGTVLEVFCQHLMAPVPRLPHELECFQPLLDAMLEKEAGRRLQHGAAVLAHIDQINGTAAPCQARASAIRK